MFDDRDFYELLVTGSVLLIMLSIVVVLVVR